MNTQIKYVTADQLWQQQSDDDKHTELIEGILVQMAPTGFQHGKITMRLARHLDNFVAQEDLGVVTAAETGFKLNETTVIAPDCAFVKKERLPQEEPEGFLPLAPDLSVEVLSPSNRASEMNRKIALLFAHGTQLVWVVHPQAHKVDVYRPAEKGEGVQVTFLDSTDTLTGNSILPGFTLPLSKLFD